MGEAKNRGSFEERKASAEPWITKADVDAAFIEIYTEALRRWKASDEKLGKLVGQFRDELNLANPNIPTMTAHDLEALKINSAPRIRLMAHQNLRIIEEEEAKSFLSKKEGDSKNAM